MNKEQVQLTPAVREGVEQILRDYKLGGDSEARRAAARWIRYKMEVADGRRERKAIREGRAVVKSQTS